MAASGRKRTPAKRTTKRAQTARTTAAPAPVTAAELTAADELPLVTVVGTPRPKARLQLGKDGKTYIVTRPKEMFLSDLQDRAGALTALGDDNATPEQKAEARKVLHEFVTCMFDSGDHAEVLEYLKDNGNDEQPLDLAHGMEQLLELWPADPAAAEAAAGL